MACFIGCASIGTGIILLVWSDKSVDVAEILLGVVLLLTAGWQFTVALRGRRIHGGLAALEVVSALVAVVLALWCIRSGHWVAVLTMWIGVAWMLRGVVQAIVAVWPDDLAASARRERVGLATLVLGVIVLVWPVNTVAGLSVLVGVCLLLLGAMEVGLAVGIRQPELDNDQEEIFDRPRPRSETPLPPADPEPTMALIPPEAGRFRRQADSEVGESTIDRHALDHAHQDRHG